MMNCQKLNGGLSTHSRVISGSVSRVGGLSAQTQTSKEVDPTVPDWAKKPSPPTAHEIGAVGQSDLITNIDIINLFK